MTSKRLVTALCVCLLLTSPAECLGEVKVALGCHGNCTALSLQCPRGGHIALLKALTRYRDLSKPYSCTSNPTLCNTCCQPSSSDCVANMTSGLFRVYYDGCWGNSSCHMPAFFESQRCSQQSQLGSSLVELQYACLMESQGINFTDSKSIAGTTLFAVFNSQNHTTDKASERNWTCHVTSTTGDSLAADVMLVNPNADEAEQNCVSLMVAPATSLQSGSVYVSDVVNTPYDVTVSPCDVRGKETIWAVMHGRNGTLNITCNVNNDNVTSFPMTKGITSSGQLTAGAITGIVVGVLLAAAVLLAVALLIRRRPREKFGSWWKDLPPRLPWTQKDDTKPIIPDKDVSAKEDQSREDDKNQYGSLTSNESP